MYLMDPVTALLCVVTFIFLAMVFYRQKKNVHPDYPPGPPTLPIIGNMHLISMGKPFVTFQELAEKYGSVYSLQIGPQNIVVLNGYETVKEALVNYAEEFSGRPPLPPVLDICNNHGLIFSNGDNWKAMKRFTLSTLKDLGMGKRTIEERILEECQCLVKNIKAYKGSPFENTEILNAAAANIIVSLLLGYRFEYDEPKLQHLLKIISDNIRNFGSPMVFLYNFFPSLVQWLPGSHRKAMPSLKLLHTFIRETFTSQRNLLDANDQKTVIDAFLAKQNEEEMFFNDANLISLISDLLSAGMDTTSTTLQWSLLLMMKYPEIQKNVQNEIEKVIGSREPQVLHRKQMPYTDAVIHEIQRFGGIVPTSLPHATTEDVTLKGFFLPKETYVIPLLYSVLRDKEHFEKPGEFYPQHFLDSDGKFVKKEAFVPFSLGKRSCVGQNLAKMELFLFFTALLQKFTFQAPPGAKLDLSPAAGFISSPLQYEMCAIPRN